MEMNNSAKKPLSFYLLLTALVVATGGGLAWSLWPEYVVVPQQPDLDQAALIARLESEAVDYKLDANGQLSVEQSQLGKSRMLQQQDPKGGFTTQGLELYDKVDYSMTEHTQQVTLQRALQGELERTLAGLNFIRYARVHLSLPEKKLFERSAAVVKAAVTVFPYQPLNQAQIEGVQSLVASAIDGMQAEQVTVLAEDGRVLSRSEKQGQWRQQQGLEAELQAKLEHLLGLLFAPSDFAVSVTARLDQTELKQTSQQLLTDAKGQGIVLSKKESSQKGAAGNPAQVPGQQTQLTEVRYGHGTKTEELNRKAGEVQQLSVAVIVRRDVPVAQQIQLKNAIVATVGYQQSRGDLLSVEFMPAEATATPAEPARALSPEQAEPVKASNFASIDLVIWSVLVLFLVVGSLGSVMLRKIYRQRLTHKERTVVLQELQQWLEKDRAHG